MAQTKYITVAELVEAHDLRTLQNLSSDTAADGTADESNTILLNAIERASADVQSYALRGGRYSASELDNLQTADDWSLKGLVVDLAVGYAFRRRGIIPPDSQEQYEKALATLEDLRDGKQVFNDTGAIAAGKPSAVVITSTERSKLDLVADSPFFPPRRTKIV